MLKILPINFFGQIKTKDCHYFILLTIKLPYIKIIYIHNVYYVYTIYIVFTYNKIKLYIYIYQRTLVKLGFVEFFVNHTMVLLTCSAYMCCLSTKLSRRDYVIFLYNMAHWYLWDMDERKKGRERGIKQKKEEGRSPPGF